MSFVPVRQVPDILDNHAGFCLSEKWDHVSGSARRRTHW